VVGKLVLLEEEKKKNSLAPNNFEVCADGSALFDSYLTAITFRP
jgi:hypothetical protein